jgi:tetratricopeptide (TPR) repeat protein
MLVCVLLSVATLATFWPIIHHEFIDFDDPDYITENPHVLSGLSWENVAWAFTTSHAANWHPVTWLSHMLDVQLFGVQPGWHHLINLLFHTANACLLFLLLERITGAQWRSALVAALFALHPLHVESVVWASERKDVLSTFFFMLTLLAYAKYVEQKTESRKQKAEVIEHGSRFQLSAFCFLLSAWYVLALGLFTLGLMSKPMLVTLPFVLLLLDYWPLDRLQFRDGLKPGVAQSSGFQIQGSRFAHILLEKVPFLALAVASSAVTFHIQREAGAVDASPDSSFESNLGNALVSYIRYISKTLWPVDLAFFYPRPLAWPAWQICLAAAALTALTLGAIRVARRRPSVLVGWFWFAGTLVPVIGLVQVGAQSMADRYTYIPAIGLFIALVWLLPGATPGWPRRKALFAPAAVIIILAALAVATRIQAGYWRSARQLYEHAVAVIKDNAPAHNNLGTMFLRQGDWAEAERHFSIAVHSDESLLEPRLNWGLVLAHQGRYAEAVFAVTNGMSRPHVKVYNRVGDILAQAGRLEEAAGRYSAALALEPDDFEAHDSLAIVLVRQKRFDAAIAQFEVALQLRPNSAGVHRDLAGALNEAGRLDEAITQFSEAVRLDPGDMLSRENIGMILGRQGKTAEAAAQFTAALQLKPDAQAHYYLALALVVLARPQQAMEHYRQAAALKPDWPDPLNDLAWILATSPSADLRNASEAVRLAQRACQLNGRKEARFLGTLDAAYAEAGRFAEAIATAEEARSLALAANNTELANQAAERLKLYRTGVPYHQTPSP